MQPNTSQDSPTLEHSPFANPSFELPEKYETYARNRATGMTRRDAALNAGYSDLGAQNAATRLEKRKDVSGRIAEIKERATQRLSIDLERLLAETMAIATVSLQDALDEAGNLLPIRSWPDHVAAAVQTVDVLNTKTVMLGADGEMVHGNSGSAVYEQTSTVTRVRMWPKLEALEKLLKHVGAYQEDNEQKRKPVSMPKDASAEQVAERYLEIMQGAKVQ